jgi:hypothetical protein
MMRLGLLVAGRGAGGSRTVGVTLVIRVIRVIMIMASRRLRVGATGPARRMATQARPAATVTRELETVTVLSVARATSTIR